MKGSRVNQRHPGGMVSPVLLERSTGKAAIKPVIGEGCSWRVMAEPCHCCWPCITAATSRSLSGACAQNQRHCPKKSSKNTAAITCAEPNRSPFAGEPIYCECNQDLWKHQTHRSSPKRKTREPP